MIKLIFIGAGGHANSCLEVVDSTKKYKVVGSVSNNNNNKLFKNLGNDKNLKKIREKYKFAHIAIGFIKNYQLRKKIFYSLKKLNFVLPTIIASSSIVSKYSNIDQPKMIMHGVIINSFAKIGKNSIINSRAVIEHDVQIGSNCHISTSVIINGNTKVGNNTFIGSGTIVFNKIKIGKNCVIGSGLIIKKDVGDNEIKK